MKSKRPKMTTQTSWGIKLKICNAKKQKAETQKIYVEEVTNA
jgi:hypothetical protein